MSNVPTAGASIANHSNSNTNTTTAPTATSNGKHGMDASKLNHTPAPLPPSPEGPPSTSPPLRDAGGPFNTSNPFAAASANNNGGGGSGTLVGGDSTGASAYLEEAPQHPTVAETGALGSSPQEGPGPRFGQLKRRDSDAKRRIIRLASFGGEGLAAKPPVAAPPEDEAEA